MPSTWLVPGSRAAKRREPASFARAWEKRREQDERGEQNLDPWEIATWRKHKALFKGTPEERTRAFRDWLEEHAAELREARSSAAERRAEGLVKEKRAREKGVSVPCGAPWRKRVRQACNPESQRKPTWASLAGGRRVEVPCADPWRFATKRDCKPKKHKPIRKAPPRPVAEAGGFFDDLLRG